MFDIFTQNMTYIDRDYFIFEYQNKFTVKVCGESSV